MSQRRIPITVKTLAAAAVAALAVTGCGIGADPGSKTVTVQATLNFGSKVVASAVEKQIPSNQTDLELMQHDFSVKSASNYPSSIDGHADHGYTTSWLLYENGILASKSPGRNKVHTGDHIWVDLHNWMVIKSKAVVGSFPEPFTDGTGGREAPTLLTCASAASLPCQQVGAELRKYKVKAGTQELGIGTGVDSNAVLVGTWAQLTGVIAQQLIGDGPQASGVYAQFVHNTTLELDNPIGDVAETLHGNVGLIAATQTGTQIAPVWFVTGTDEAGVEAAAKAFNETDLHDRFAAVIYGGKIISVPLTKR